MLATLGLNLLKSREIYRTSFYLFLVPLSNLLPCLLYCYLHSLIAVRYVYLPLIFSLVPGSSVGIATDYGPDGPGSNPGAEEIFWPSRPALGPTQPPVQWVPSLSRG